MHRILEIDKLVLFWINGHHNIVLDAILAPAAYAGEVAAIWIIVCLAMLIFGKSEHRKTAVLLLLTIIIVDRVFSAQLAGILHFDRARPYMAIDGIRQLGIRWTSGSFPSGHAHSVWIAAIILSDKWRKLTIPLVIFAILTCYSRPYFSMHYPLDTLAGALLGITAGFTVVGIRRLCAHQGKFEKFNED